MATVKHTIAAADGWVEIAADGEDYLVENVSLGVALITQQAAPPAADAPYHRIQAGQVMVHVGTGAAYVRAQNDECVVVVTK